MISTVLTVYKEPWAWIEQSIDSIISQSYKKIQVIVVVDNPMFNKYEKIKELFIKDAISFKIIKNPKNIGLVKSLNKGIEAADGEFIARMDSDDIAKPDRFIQELNFLNEFNLDFVASAIDLIDERGKLIKKEHFKRNLTGNLLKRIEIQQNIFWHPTWLMKKKVWLKLKGYREINTAEDYDFVVRALLNKFKLGILRFPTLFKRIAEDSISETNGLQQITAAKMISRSFRRGKIVKLSKAKIEVNDKRKKDYCQLRISFNKRKQLNYKEKIKLTIKICFTRTGRLFIKAVLIQKYQLKLLRV